jgi:TM2 domain-containing membrane protein YozV
MSQTGTTISSDAQALIAFEAGKKSTGLAYVLWFFLGGFGGHRFYIGRTGSAVAILLINIFGWLTIAIGIGVAMLVGLGIWLIVDAFLIPGWVRRHNTMLMARLTGGVSPLSVMAGL